MVINIKYFILKSFATDLRQNFFAPPNKIVKIYSKSNYFDTLIAF